MSKKKCCKSKKPCKDCPRNKKKKIGAAYVSTGDAQHSPFFFYRIMLVSQ